MGCKSNIKTKVIRVKLNTYDNLKSLKESKQSFDDIINKLYFSYRKRTLNELVYKNEVRKHYVELLLKTLDEMEIVI